MVYTWKSNARIKADPEIAAAEFDRLDRSGGLTPKRVVEASRPKSAPLHDEFEWNDKAAAEKYRERQAQHLIMCLMVRDETDLEVEQAPVRAYFSVTEPTEYTHVTKIATDADMTARLLDQAARDWTIFRDKYQRLQGLAQMFPPIDAYMAQRRSAEGRAAV